MLCEGLSPGSAACPRQCLSLARPDPARSCALKMAASAGLGTAVPRGGGALCPEGIRGCCASTAQRTPLAARHLVAVSSCFPGHPVLHSRLPVPFREIINGIPVTDENNNELGRSRVSPGRVIWVGAWLCWGSPAAFACRGRQ